MRRLASGPLFYLLAVVLSSASLPLAAQSRDSTMRAQAKLQTDSIRQDMVRAARAADSVDAILKRWRPDTMTVTLPAPRPIHDTLIITVPMRDSAHIAKVRAFMDSIYRVATNAKVDAWAKQVDTLEQRQPVATVAVGTNYLTTTLWPVGFGAFPPAGTQTLCATVLIGATTYLGSPAVQATLLRPDSVAYVLRAESGGPLQALCGSTLGTHGVRWGPVAAQVAVGAPKIALPFAFPVVP